MAVVMVPSSLRRYTDEKRSVIVPGDTVKGLLEYFTGRSPELRNHLFDSATLRKFVVVFKNGRDIRQLEGLATPLLENDEIQIVASVAGG